LPPKNARVATLGRGTGDNARVSIIIVLDVPRQTVRIDALRHTTARDRDITRAATRERRA
jgi:hypothetical protein